MVFKALGFSLLRKIVTIWEMDFAHKINMAEIISLEVKGKFPKKLLTKIYREITPNYVKNLLEQNNMSTDKVIA